MEMSRSFKMRLAAMLTAIAMPVLGIPSVQAAQHDLCRGGYECLDFSGYNSTSGNWANKYYRFESYDAHNCTRYAAYRLEQAGVGDPGRSFGNAFEWGAKAPYGKDNVPAVGSIAYWNKKGGLPYGHVAVVEAVNPDGSIEISEDHAFPVSGGLSSVRVLSGSSLPDLYIHAADAQVAQHGRHHQDAAQQAPKPPRLIGNLDEITSTEIGELHMRGWGLDTEDPNHTLDIHVYIGGPAGTPGAEGIALGAADVDRPDVDNVHHKGSHKGFDRTFKTSKRGDQEICTYLISDEAHSDVENQLLECRQGRIRYSSPDGDFEAMGGPGTVSVSGWGLDHDDLGFTSNIHLYIGGQAGSEQAEGHILGAADIPRPDLEELADFDNRHGFVYSTDTNKRGKQDACLYVIGRDDNKLVGCKQVTIF